MVKVGDRLVIYKMSGEPEYNGAEGCVTHIDDAGQIHGTWGGCALIPDVDEFEVKTPSEGDDTPNIKVVIQHGKVYGVWSSTEKVQVDVVNLDTDDDDEAAALCNVMEHITQEMIRLDLEGGE